MEEMTARTGSALFKIEIEHLQDFLHAAIGHFRDGEDAAGMEDFLHAVEELERVVEADWNAWQPQIDLIQLLPALRELHFYMQNQDIDGISDLLEYTIFPLTKEWLKGCDNA